LEFPIAGGELSVKDHSEVLASKTAPSKPVADTPIASTISNPDKAAEEFLIVMLLRKFKTGCFPG
jgi:hypothetical protein